MGRGRPGGKRKVNPPSIVVGSIFAVIFFRWFSEHLLAWSRAFLPFQAPLATAVGSLESEKRLFRASDAHLPSIHRTGLLGVAQENVSSPSLAKIEPTTIDPPSFLFCRIPETKHLAGRIMK
jgi:hypothetical protein